MADPVTIHNWRRLDDRITTSGQPTEPQLADIHALGVRHIVNLGLHTHEKALPDEAASVSRLGMTYLHIPVDFQNPTDEDFAKFCVEMARLEEVQCMSIASRITECQPSFIIIVAMYLVCMKSRRVPISNRFGTPKGYRRRLSVVRLLNTAYCEARALLATEARVIAAHTS